MRSETTISLRAAVALAALAAVCAGVAGCKTPLERAWGLSQRAHVAQTIANPEAGLQDLDARIPDGMSTDAALTKFRTKETEVAAPEPPPVININN